METKSVQEAFDIYKDLVAKGPAKAGDFASQLDDATAKAVYDLCCSDPKMKNKLVRPLWYNYEKQEFRW